MDDTPDEQEQQLDAETLSLLFRACVAENAGEALLLAAGLKRIRSRTLATWASNDDLEEQERPG